MKKLLIGSAVVLALLVLGILVWPNLGQFFRAHANSKQKPPLEAKVIRPRLESLFVRRVKAPAYVEAYYKVDLVAQVAGQVKKITKDYGDMVFEGEIIAEIEVPELAQMIAQKAAVIERAKAERDSAKAHLETLLEGIRTAQSRIPEKKSALKEKMALRDLRESELMGYLTLAKKEAINRDLVDEKRKDVLAARAAVDTAEAAIITVKSELRQVEAKLSEAVADLRFKEQNIHVAEKDKERVEVQGELAKIRAPFNGVINKRFVEPGSFVQNAASGRALPLVTLMRLDMVKITMKVPERAAQFLTNNNNTDATVYIEVEGRPIKNLRSRVTRKSPFLDAEEGRTMNLEMEVYNPREYGYKKSCRRGVQTFLAPLGGVNPLGVAATSVFSRKRLNREGLLRPGSYGQMELVLETFKNCLLIPTSAIFSYKNKHPMLTKVSTHIMVVQNGKIHCVPVRVQFDNGIQARVMILRPTINPDTGDLQEQELTGLEEIVLSGQGEFAEGQKVRTSRAEKW